MFTDEFYYQSLIANVINNGKQKFNRTGTSTISLFGTQSRYCLRDNKFPLLTTKTMFFRGIVEELLWFISGSTNSNKLTEKNIHIWDVNGSKDFLNKNGFENRNTGDLGPIYGFQWRHFGAKYIDMNTDYTNQGIDQLQKCIDIIKTNPDSRRIIMTAWNPLDIDQIVLPPCHCFVQFYVSDGELSCQLYQRSADVGLGVPFNIASYSLLTIMIAHITDLKPGDFIHSIGDTHIYLNHLDKLKNQCKLLPKNFPTLKIKRKINNIDDFMFDDFELIGYDPYPKIYLDMAI